MQLDPETASLLGWDEIKKVLAGLTRTPYGARKCQALKPSTDLDWIRQAQARHAQMAWLLDQGSQAPIESIDPVENDLERAKKGGVLDAEAVLRVARALDVSSQVRAYLMREGSRAGEALVDMARGSHDLAHTARDLSAAFEPDGRLRDSASADLMRLRRRASRLSDNIRVRLERLMRSGPIADAVGDSYITQRADRHVLPIRSDSRSKVAGIVHDTSQSGATLFIEPAAVVDEGNKLKIAQAAVFEEERRILAEYSREIAEASSALADNLRMLAAADQVLASVRLGEGMKGRLPELGGAGFDLRKTRHPLMALGDGVVANDIFLPAARMALVVTGPNAGGKTVVLKSLGLCCLMAQAGLPIPVAEGTRLGVFTVLSAVIGDSQDITQGLSTFSAHIERIGRILKDAGPGKLVLLDELVADTDPRHGAALAAAILTELVDQGATVLVTTHFEALKQLPFEDERFANASVGFDLTAMAPTFRLHPDVPGRSLTLDIARRLGLPEQVLQNASDRLDGSQQDLEAMLEKLETERQGLEVLRSEMALARSESERRVLAQRQAEAELSERRAKLLGDGRESLLQEIADVRQEVAQVIESLRSGDDMRTAVESSQKLIELGEQVQADQNQAESTLQVTPPSALEPPGETLSASDAQALQAGDRVRLLHLKQVGEVISVDRAGAMVSVRIGPGYTRVPIERIQRLAEQPLAQDSAGTQKTRVEKQKGRSAKKPPKPAAPSELRTPVNTLDLRGHRVDEAVDMVDKFLDEMFGGGEAAAFLLHGHGTGALKAAVREYLQDSPYPRHFRAGTQAEGGDGITVVALK